VLVTYGLADVLVPSAHGAWLAANIPTAVTLVSQQGGHMPGDRDREITETMAWLRDGTVPPGAGN
jgi:pimeloyl-ACP methyl ester carboxylesterase